MMPSALRAVEARRRAGDGRTPDDGPGSEASRAVARAWALRQGDPQAARAAVARARSLLPAASTDARGRLHLAEAVRAWLEGDDPAFERLCRAAEEDWGRDGDAGGRADLGLLRARHQFDSRHHGKAIDTLAAAEAIAAAAGDTRRERYLKAMGIFWSLGRRFTETVARWGPALEALRGGDDDELAMVVESYTAMVAAWRGDLAAAIVGFGRAYAHALAAGEVRFAITSANNLGAAWANHQRYDEAVRWLEQALALARRQGWPQSIAQCLKSLGAALCNLGRCDGAAAAYEEALQVWPAAPQSRNTLLTRMGLAEARLAQGRPHEAEALFAAVEPDVRALFASEILDKLLYMRALALLALGDVGAADRCAREALVIARADGVALNEIEILKVLARVHAGDADAEHGFLAGAVERGRGLPGWQPQPALLLALANSHIRRGDAHAAWPLLLEAHRTEHVRRERGAQARGALAEAAQTLERERMAADTARREARRQEREADLLATANRSLADLGRLGRQLLLQTSREDIACCLAQTVPGLLPLSAVALLAPGAVVETDTRASRRVRLLPLRMARSATCGATVDHGTLRVELHHRADPAVRQMLRTLAAWVALGCARVAALEDLRHARRQLRAAQRDADLARQRLDHAVQERRRSAGFINHDLRAPLATMQGLLDTLRAPPASLGSGERVRYLHQARQAADRLQAMVEGLRDLAEDGPAQPPAAVFVPALVRRVFEQFELPAQRRGLRLEMLCERDLPPVLADAAMVERVLVNLMDNAVRHAAPGGRVRVELAEGRCSLNVSVLNDGEPIPPERRAALFRRPATAPVQHRSAGLGLLAVQRMLALQGASVRASVRPGWAVAFEFALSADA